MIPGKDIKAKREALKLSLEELEAKLGVGKMTIWAWELDMAHPDSMQEKLLEKIFAEEEAKHK
jgi:DNA-binding transcriptional regulator YiaG